MIGVFDGCGGLGSRRFKDHENHTAAYIAARVAGKATLEWFEKHMPLDQTMR